MTAEYQCLRCGGPATGVTVLIDPRYGSGYCGTHSRPTARQHADAAPGQASPHRVDVVRRDYLDRAVELQVEAKRRRLRAKFARGGELTDSERVLIGIYPCPKPQPART